VTNYELGIVFSLRDEADVERVVSYERPPKRYGSRDRPWVSSFGGDLAQYSWIVSLGRCRKRVRC
jgi:tyrosyl-DNA phosphodiesterase-1